MKSKGLKYIILLLVCIVGISAFIHLSNQDSIKEGSILLTYQNKEIEVSVNDLSLTHVEGTRINGKGESKKVTGEGILLYDLLEQYQIKEYKEVKVEAIDSYYATILPNEIQETKRVYLLKDDKGLRLIVFEDENSKRSVSNVAKIIVE